MVLDWVDGSLSSPVDGGWDGDGVEDGWHLDHVLWDLGTKELFVLLMGPGGEEVVSNGESVLGVGVDDGVLGILGVEDGLSEFEFFGGGEVESVFGDVLDEFEVDGGGGESLDHFVKIKINY